MEWIYKCGVKWNYCPDGFCEVYNNHKENHRRPAVEMSKEWKEKTGEDKKPEAIRKLFERLTVTKRHVYQKPDYETCTTKDLEKLIEAKQTFGAIYADPPWPYQNQATRSSTSENYPVMHLNEIENLPIAKLSADVCHLHLWTTNAFLFESKQIIESWGFEYKSCFVWVKPQMGIGNYWRVSHEFLLLGVKGKATFKEKKHKSWMPIDRTSHSTKPEIIAQIIERVSPGPWLELFGRKLRPNWTVWGNEIKRELFTAENFKK